MQDGTDISGSHFTFRDDTSCMHLKSSFSVLFCFFFFFFFLINWTWFLFRFAIIHAEMTRGFSVMHGFICNAVLKLLISTFKYLIQFIISLF